MIKNSLEESAKGLKVVGEYGNAMKYTALAKKISDVIKEMEKSIPREAKGE